MIVKTIQKFSKNIHIECIITNHSFNIEVIYPQFFFIQFRLKLPTKSSVHTQIQFSLRRIIES